LRLRFLVNPVYPVFSWIWLQTCEENVKTRISKVSSLRAKNAGVEPIFQKTRGMQGEKPAARPPGRRWIPFSTASPPVCGKQGRPGQKNYFSFL
jgi:hypothetical protein